MQVQRETANAIGESSLRLPSLCLCLREILPAPWQEIACALAGKSPETALTTLALVQKNIKYLITIEWLKLNTEIENS